MDLTRLSTDQLAAEISRRSHIEESASAEWRKAREATKAARRAETPHRKAYYDWVRARRDAEAERNRREEILNNIGR